MKKATKESVMFKLVEKWQKSASGAVEEINLPLSFKERIIHRTVSQTFSLEVKKSFSSEMFVVSLRWSMVILLWFDNLILLISSNICKFPCYFFLYSYIFCV